MNDTQKQTFDASDAGCWFDSHRGIYIGEAVQEAARLFAAQTEASATQLRSTGTLTFDNTVAVTEHGLFSQAATGGGVLWDRSIFTAVNVVSGDSIQFQYTASLTAGG